LKQRLVSEGLGKEAAVLVEVEPTMTAVVAAILS
jgi:hypothetical protein